MDTTTGAWVGPRPQPDHSVSSPVIFGILVLPEGQWGGALHSLGSLDWAKICLDLPRTRFLHLQPEQGRGSPQRPSECGQRAGSADHPESPHPGAWRPAHPSLPRSTNRQGRTSETCIWKAPDQQGTWHAHAGPDDCSRSGLTLAREAGSRTTPSHTCIRTPHHGRSRQQPRFCQGAHSRT